MCPRNSPFSYCRYLATLYNSRRKKMKKYARVSGKRAAIYLGTQARRLNDAAGQARQEAEVELPADGAAIDTAYNVCRYCFNEFQKDGKGLEKGSRMAYKFLF